MSTFKNAIAVENSAAARIIGSLPGGLFIAGQWQEAEDGRRFPVIDPADASILAHVADASISDGRRAIDAAEKAGESWAATSPRKRSEILLRCFEIMNHRAEWLAQIISLENGKAMPDARGEVAYAAEFFRWYSEEAVRSLGEVSRAPSGQYRILAQHQPIGISVLITPWNFPAAMATRKIAPALAAGCTCILKPAPETPLTALAVVELMQEAGVPDGVVNVVTTTQAGPVVSAMLHDPRVRKLSFTGSTNVGRVLLREAADQVLSCSMELGGNAPFVVFNDANLEDAVSGAMVAKMRNGGEACTAANRFYVQRGIYESFVRRLGEEMGRLAVGRGINPVTQCGPLINERAVGKVSSLVEDALRRGARRITGGKALQGEGYFYQPTVLADVPVGSNILNEEIFGPVAVLVPFDDEDEAVRLANQTEYGLVAYVYSGDLGRALRVGERIEAGMVGINRGVVSDPAAPFGGMKQSGLGREGAHHGLLEYLEVKYLSVAW